MHPWSPELQEEFVQKPQVMMIFINLSREFDMDTADNENLVTEKYTNKKIKMAILNLNFFVNVALDKSWPGWIKNSDWIIMEYLLESVFRFTLLLLYNKGSKTDVPLLIPWLEEAALQPQVCFGSH